jgi:hypothetical protein
MFNTYKHLHNLTFVSCLLNNQQHTTTLIFMNSIPSVSYCSTAMLYVLFNCLCIVYLTKLRFPVHHGKDFKLWSVEVKIDHWGMWGRQQTLKLETFVYGLERCLCHITFCNCKCLNIGLFHSSAVFYTSLCYQSQSIHTQPTITVDTTPYSIKRCLCHIAFCNYKCIISAFPQILLSFIHSHIIRRNDSLQADCGLFLHPAA